MVKSVVPCMLRSMGSDCGPTGRDSWPATLRSFLLTHSPYLVVPVFWYPRLGFRDGVNDSVDTLLEGAGDSQGCCFPLTDGQQNSG